MLSFKLALATAFALTVVALPAAMPDVFPTILTDMLDDGSENHTSSMLARDEDQQKPVCHMQFEDGYFRCYKETSRKQIVGNPQSVSDVEHCNSDSCDAIVSQTYTVSQSFTFSIGVDGSASVGASWSWSHDQAVSTSQSFTLKKGDSARIVFFPYLHKSCGRLATTGADCGGYEACQPYPLPPDVNDKHACGTTAVLLDPNASGHRAADGVTQLCYTAGPNKGKGCHHAPQPKALE